MPHQRANQAYEEELVPYEGRHHPNAYPPSLGPDPDHPRNYAQTQLPQPHEQDPYARPQPIGTHLESTFVFEASRARRQHSPERAHVTGAGVATGSATGYYVAEDGNNKHRHRHERPPRPAMMAGQETPVGYVDDGQQQHWGAYPSRLAAPSPSNTIPTVDNFSDDAAGASGGVYRRQGAQSHYHDRPGHIDGDATPDRGSQSSLMRLNVSARAPGDSTPGRRTPTRSPHSFGGDEYDPYGDYSTHRLPKLGMVDPNEIDDDGDDGINYGRKAGPGASVLSLAGSNRNDRPGAGVDGGHYAPVNSTSTAYDGAGAHGSALKVGTSAMADKKSPWRSSSGALGRRFRLCIVLVVGLVVIGAVATGVVVSVMTRVKRINKSEGSTPALSSSTHGSPSDTAGDLDVSSPDIQSLMNNMNLHKVFPGIDYTPPNTQYPDCLADPPSQNNITKDMAVLSQLTNTVRLYGNDCNQTEMVLHALGQLKLDKTVKVWLGVWQDGNDTTNARQLAQMWDILDKYGATPFKGLIVANEIIYRKEMSASQLGNLLGKIRTGLISKGMSLPVGTSDLGDNWTADLAQASDLILANIHPFFAGINAKEAARWTYSFWKTRDAGVFKSDNSKNIISETGWPTQGGTDCGSSTVMSCPDGAVASIDGMNQFMSDWVCQALANGTQYFWFEAFDESWKIPAGQGSEELERHWGFMDVDRKLKSGVKIPDCGGKTVS